MVNKKMLISCLLILLVAISVSAVSAADEDADVIADTDVLASADDNTTVVSVGNIIYVDGDDDVAVSTAMANASDGDIIELGDTGYTFNNGIEVTKQLTFHGDNATIYANGSQMPDGVFVVKADGAGTAFQDLSFINTDDADSYLYKYNGMVDAKGKSVKTSVGIAIDLDSAANNVFIDNCYFVNWFNSAVSINSANFATVQNSQFYGGSATFINNLPDGPKDRGTYHISVMSSRGTTVDNCYFGDTVCDGVSVAGGSYDSTIINNIFENNAFSIYFGGKATEGTLIANNTFINSGWFESPVYGPNGTTGETINFQDLPVISVQKSSDSFVIADNTFYARNSNMLIKALEGSTAHGGESNIGNISIVDNTVLGMDKYDSSFGKVVMASVFLTYIETYNDIIRPIGEIRIANNNLNGARSAVYWTQKWGNDQGDVSIKQADIPTTIAISSLRDSTIKGVLKDFDGKGVGGATISYTSDSGNGTVETEFDGYFVIGGVHDIVNLEFVESGNYKGTTATVDVAPALTENTYLDVDDIFADYYGAEASAVLMGEHVLINGEDLTFVVNGKSYTATTDVFGYAAVSLAGLAPGTYNVDVYYDGNGYYLPSNATFVLVVNKITSSVSAFYDGATNEIVATLTNNAIDKAIGGANVAITLNGAKTTLKADANGQVRLSLGDVDPNSFTAEISYNGNSKYYGSSLTIKSAESKTTSAISTVYDKEAGEIVSTLINSKTGNVIGGANVVINVNGQNYAVKTDANGQARLSTTEIPEGVYKVTSTYKGNSKYVGTKAVAYVVNN